MTTDEQRLAWAIPWLELVLCLDCHNCYHARATECPSCSSKARAIPATWAGETPEAILAARGEEE